MLRTTMKILCLTVFLCAQAGFAHADQKWVDITIINGSTTAEYDGAIDSAAYDQITKKLDDKGMLQLSSVYWLDAQGKVTPIKDLQINGVKYGYTDTMFVNEADIIKIISLDKDYIEGLLKVTAKS